MIKRCVFFVECVHLFQELLPEISLYQNEMILLTHLAGLEYRGKTFTIQSINP